MRFSTSAATAKKKRRTKPDIMQSEMRTRHIRPPGPMGMNMSQRARLMRMQWALLALAFTILHVLLFVSWIIIGTRAPDSPILVVVVMTIYAVLFATIVVVFCHRLNRAADPVVYREAREYGQPATAKVLKIERTLWRVRRSLNFSLRFRPQRFEYQMRLRVTRAGAVNYDADMAEYLSGADVPEGGDVIAVKVHPQHPDVVVLSRDKCPRPSHRGIVFSFLKRFTKPTFWGCTDFR